MYTYSVEYDKEPAQEISADSLDALHALVVPVMKANNYKLCLITTPSGALRRVRATKEQHWNYPGFSFD